MLEVLLVLVLMSLLFLAVGMAVDIHLRLPAQGRRQVEAVQIARAVLQRIASDIGHVVPIQEKSQQADTSGRQGSSASESDGQGEGNGQTEESADVMGFDQFFSFLGTAEAAVTGLFGESTWLQLDVSIAAQPLVLTFAQTGPIVTGDTQTYTYLLNDVKTVVYAFNEPPEGAELLPTSATTMQFVSSNTVGTLLLQSLEGLPPGLYRKELNKAQAAWELEQGGLDLVFTEEDLFAPEVTSVAFAYFDGMEWYDSWDSTATGKLPVAIEIVLTVDPTAAQQYGNLMEQQSVLSTSSVADTESEFATETVYRLVVYLPLSNSMGYVEQYLGLEELESQEGQTEESGGQSEVGPAPETGVSGGVVSPTSPAPSGDSTTRPQESREPSRSSPTRSEEPNTRRSLF